MTKYEKFHVITGSICLIMTGFMVYALLHQDKASTEEEANVCEDTSFKDGNPVFLENKPALEIIQVDQKKPKKFFDRFKPMAKTVVANKLLNEVIENRDVMVTIHFMKGDV